MAVGLIAVFSPAVPDNAMSHSACLLGNFEEMS